MRTVFASNCMKFSGDEVYDSIQYYRRCNNNNSPNYIVMSDNTYEFIKTDLGYIGNLENHCAEIFGVRIARCNALIFGEIECV